MVFSDLQPNISAATIFLTPDKLVIWGSWDGMADILDEHAPYWKAYQEATGTEVEFIDATGGKEALSVLISTMTTGDMPDIIIDYDFNIPTGVQQSLLDETIIPLNGPMEAGYMPHFKAYLESDEGIMLSNYGKEGKTFNCVDGVPTLSDWVLDNPDGMSAQQALSLYAGYKNKSFMMDINTYVNEKKLLFVYGSKSFPDTGYYHT